jgi:hypothetical protein
MHKNMFLQVLLPSSIIANVAKNGFNKKAIKLSIFVLAPWHCGHHVGVQNRISRVRIPPGCKVVRFLYIAVRLSNLNTHCHCVYWRKIKKKTSKIKKYIHILSNVPFYGLCATLPKVTDSPIVLLKIALRVLCK